MRLLTLLLVSGMLASVPAFASAEAERYRLQQELQTLAQRSAWSGVERMYLELVALGLPLTPNDHLLGSQAASGRGDTLAAMDRLELAVAAGTAETSAADPAWQQAKVSLEALQARYGKVAITVVAPRLAALIRYQPPFAADEREAIESARQALTEKMTYAGLLPVGKYMVDGLVFEVQPGQDVLDVKVTP